MEKYIRNETLSDNIFYVENLEGTDVDFDGEKIIIRIEKK
jgi:hypothetical protein